MCLKLGMSTQNNHEGKPSQQFWKLSEKYGTKTMQEFDMGKWHGNVKLAWSCQNLASYSFVECWRFAMICLWHLAQTCHTFSLALVLLKFGNLAWSARAIWHDYAKLHWFKTYTNALSPFVKRRFFRRFLANIRLVFKVLRVVCRSKFSA